MLIDGFSPQHLNGQASHIVGPFLLRSGRKKEENEKNQEKKTADFLKQTGT